MKPPTGSSLLLEAIAREGTVVPYRKGRVIFSQGDTADAVFSILRGRVKLTVVSKQNKEAVIAILSVGDLVGEASLVGQQPIRLATASALLRPFPCCEFGDTSIEDRASRPMRWRSPYATRRPLAG